MRDFYFFTSKKITAQECIDTLRKEIKDVKMNGEDGIMIDGKFRSFLWFSDDTINDFDLSQEEKESFASFEVFSFLLEKKNKDISMIIVEYFSMFNPTINEVIVVAILLPKTIPILWLNVNKFAFRSAITIIIRAELDWIIEVEMNPVNTLECRDEVSLFSLLFTLSIESFNKSLVSKSIEYINKITPPSNIVTLIFYHQLIIFLWEFF